jgi:glycosyltransferase involved in cell wall biosynthesis
VNDVSGNSVPPLAAVIVARNEETRIGECIESVREAGMAFEGFEVVVVDSRSTDRTADIARRHDVRTVRIRPAIRCTAALARVVGQRMTRSRHVLFVDGDTIIERNWLVRAVDLLDAQRDLAGIGGMLREVYYRGGTRVGEIADFFRMGPGIEEAYQLGGNALYRRAALERVGSFHGGVISHEEAELAGRLRRTGYRLVRIPATVGTHHTGARDTFAEGWRRFRSGLMVGYGQVLRLGLGTPLFWSHARALNRYVGCLAFVALGLGLAAASLVSGQARFAAAWLAVAGLGFAALVIRARGFRRPLSVVGDWVLASPGIVWGFVRGPLRLPSDDPQELVEVLHVPATRARAGGVGSC